MDIGVLFPTNNYGDIEILEYLGNSKYKIRFLNTGTISEARKDKIKLGQIKDSFAPTVAGVGFLGNGKTTTNPKIYYRWKTMLYRCYDSLHPDFYKYGERGYRVAVEWHCYEKYEADFMQKIEEIGFPDRFKVELRGKIFSKENLTLLPKR